MSTMTGKRLLDETGKKVRYEREYYLGKNDASSGGNRPRAGLPITPNTPLPSHSRNVPQQVHYEKQTPMNSLLGTDPITWSPSYSEAEPSTYQTPKQNAGSFSEGDPGWQTPNPQKTVKILVIIGAVVILYYFITSRK